jgi:predicted Zn-ribbon and HTH transcriptional regulator
MLNCPLCHSEHIYRSRRRGIVERRILTMVFVRPFRCAICNFRFFRWSIATNPNLPPRQTTS